jgi:catechol 2,3-dioxygenase-like lactoylglutathione lyase family enzyme
MKRLHIHLSVDDLEQSINFYNTLFACSPAVQHADYAKWMLDDPRINFAISTRAAKAGLDHLGFQVDDEQELAAIKQRLDATQRPIETQEGAACCYSRSDKHWITDPQGIAWESFHTLADIPTFNEAEAASDGENPFACRPAENSGSSCCGS